jgi:molybdenum cofactor cytidylyltransferase
MSAEQVGAIILAAGASSRLGQPKQFLHHEGEMLLHRAARAAGAAGCVPVIVVAGQDHLRIKTELNDLGAQILHHPQWQKGIGSSIRAGLNHALSLHPALDALIVMVCDQPFVTSEVLVDLIATRTPSRKRSAACTYAGTIGVPALFDRSLFPSLRELHDDQGAKAILSTHASDIARIPFPEGEIDIDTPADLSAFGKKRQPVEKVP